MFNALAFNGASSRRVVLDYDKPLIVPAGTDTLAQIGTPSLLNDELRKQGIRNPIDLWQAAYEQYFPPANGGDTQVRALGRVIYLSWPDRSRAGARLHWGACPAPPRSDQPRPV